MLQSMGLQGIRHDVVAEQQFLKMSVGQFRTQQEIPLDKGGKQVTELREAAGWDLQAVPWRPLLIRAAGIQLQTLPSRNLGPMSPNFTRVNRNPILTWNRLIFNMLDSKRGVGGHECYMGQTKYLCRKKIRLKYTYGLQA